MKTIDTLIPDIYDLIRSKKEGWFDEQLATALSSDISVRLRGQLGQGTRQPTLRMSAMGPRCPRALWYSIHRPELQEPLPAWAEVKFAFGHIIEALAVALAKAAGHTVEGEQDELRYDGIVGHRDCVIDGCIVDVKSSSSIAFQKFKSGDFSKSDNFGYLDQLDCYLLASREDPLVTNKGTGYLFAVDKQLGHMCLYKHEVTDERERTLKARIAEYKQIVALEQPPACTCGTVEGTYGNIQLDFKASYSPFKFSCRPNLRGFIGPKGPVYFTKLNKIPLWDGKPLKEIDRNGRHIFH